MPRKQPVKFGTGDLAANSVAARETKRMGASATEGQIPVVFRVDVGTVADGTTENNDVTLDYKVRVIDMWIQMQGAGTTSDTVALKNGANAITDTVSIAASGDKAVVRCGEIDDAYHEIAAAGTLRVAATDGGGGDFPDISVYVLALMVT